MEISAKLKYDSSIQIRPISMVIRKKGQTNDLSARVPKIQVFFGTPLSGIWPECYTTCGIPKRRDSVERDLFEGEVNFPTINGVFIELLPAKQRAFNATAYICI